MEAPSSFRVTLRRHTKNTKLGAEMHKHTLFANVHTQKSCMLCTCVNYTQFIKTNILLKEPHQCFYLLQFILYKSLWPKCVFSEFSVTANLQFSIHFTKVYKLQRLKTCLSQRITLVYHPPYTACGTQLQGSYWRCKCLKTPQKYIVWFFKKVPVTSSNSCPL